MAEQVRKTAGFERPLFELQLSLSQGLHGYIVESAEVKRLGRRWERDKSVCRVWNRFFGQN